MCLTHTKMNLYIYIYIFFFGGGGGNSVHIPTLEVKNENPCPNSQFKSHLSQ